MNNWIKVYCKMIASLCDMYNQSTETKKKNTKPRIRGGGFH